MIVGSKKKYSVSLSKLYYVRLVADDKKAIFKN